jgi:shikimate dehydrogenase
VSPGGTTRVAAVLGWPVAHTLSPAMHNAAFAAMGLDWTYVALPVRPESLPAAIAGARALSLGGLSITIPHKVAVIPLLDGLLESAERVGAVNTVVFRDGRALGANTDGDGFLRSVGEEAGFAPAGARVAVIGSGGAARGVALAAAAAGAAAIRVASRSAEQANAIALDAALCNPGAITSVQPLDGALWDADEAPFDLVVQATPLGMAKSPGDPAWEQAITVFDRLLPPDCSGTILSDLVYRPALTPLLTVGASRGGRLHGGLGMLVHQGALALELWTGLPAPVGAMRAAAEQALTATSPTHAT